MFLFCENYEKYTDLELLKMFQNWNDHIFEIIYLRYKDKIYSYIWNILNYNEQDTLNVSADVFLKVFKYLKQKNIENLKSFLYKTAHNESINYITQNKYKFTNIDGNQSNNQNNSWIKIIDKVNIDYKKLIIKELLSMIDEKYRQCIYLYYYENMDYTEIAQIVWTNKNTIWTYIRRWKQCLSDLIVKEWFKDDLIN